MKFIRLETQILHPPLLLEEKGPGDEVFLGSGVEVFLGPGVEEGEYRILNNEF